MFLSTGVLDVDTISSVLDSVCSRPLRVDPDPCFLRVPFFKREGLLHHIALLVLCSEMRYGVLDLYMSRPLAKKQRWSCSGVFGNEEADKLSKAGSHQEQTDHSVSLGEVKSILRSHFRTKWKERLNVQTQKDRIFIKTQFPSLNA